MRLNLAHQRMSREWVIAMHSAVWYAAIIAMYFGGSGRNRTGVDGFAIRCITTLPPSLVVAADTLQR